MADPDRVREVYEAWDPDATDAWIADHFAPDAEWVDPPALPDAGHHRGAEEVKQMVDALVGVAGPFEMHVQEVLDAGREALVVFHMVGRGEHSGIPVDLIPSHAVTVVDGRVTRVRGFLSREEGLLATGLAVES
jgi:ketosteroid isomerase-like protein